MNIHTASNLNFERFRKVYALVTGGETDGERASVMSMLDTQPELSDREISRRLGVSPQTAGNWRGRIV